MKVTKTKASIPFFAPDHALEFDIVPFRGRAKARVLVFDTPRHLQKFWKTEFQYPLGNKCLGVVRPLWWDHFMLPSHDRIRREIDPKYFCIVGLSREDLGCEILSHESVHAGAAWLRRKGLFLDDQHETEEDLAYATGKVFRVLVQKLRRVKLL